jgi:hypothetical protein
MKPLTTKPSKRSKKLAIALSELCTYDEMAAYVLALLAAERERAFKDIYEFALSRHGKGGYVHYSELEALKEPRS